LLHADHRQPSQEISEETTQALVAESPAWQASRGADALQPSLINSLLKAATLTHQRHGLQTPLRFKSVKSLKNAQGDQILTMTVADHQQCLGCLADTIR
tara:strand:+ start:1253 stop:1549 length:297 start_codon:yes stop_codon:yes gene_type:complete